MRLDSRRLKPEGVRSIVLGTGIVVCSVLTMSVSFASAQGRVPFSRNTPSVLYSTPDLAAESDGYILGAGDRVKVDFFNASEYTAEFPVLPNGTIQFPLEGAINVRGISLTEAGTRVSARLKPYFKRSIATVTLITARPLGVSISGEVNRPGSYTLSANPSATESTIPNLPRVI